jgi:hypothetical protein
MSTNHTSPWRGFISVKNIEDLLLYLPGGQDVDPGFLLLLTGQEFQIVQDLAQHRLRLAPDFLDQKFLSAHN